MSRNRRFRLRHETALKILCAILVDPTRRDVSDEQEICWSIAIADRLIALLDH